MKKENLFETLDILNQIIDNSKTKIVNLMFYYHMNDKDEINLEIKDLINEIRSGLYDPSRIVAEIEIQ